MMENLIKELQALLGKYNADIQALPKEEFVIRIYKDETMQDENWDDVKRAWFWSISGVDKNERE